MTTTSAADAGIERGTTRAPPLSRTVDLAVAAVMVVAGSLFVAGGWLVAGFADIDRVTAWVASGRVTSTEMTDPELIDAVFALLWGTGVGMAVLGALVVVAGLLFLALETRARRRFAATGVATPSTVASAILGGTVTLVGAAVPFSPVLGGLVSGYLGQAPGRNGLAVGSLAGLVATVPLVVAFGAITWSLLGSTSGLTGLMVATLTFSLVISVAYMVGLGALGGYLGDRVATDRRAA